MRKIPYVIIILMIPILKELIFIINNKGPILHLTTTHTNYQKIIIHSRKIIYSLYKVLTKYLYNLKNILQKKVMKYFNQIFCMYSYQNFSYSVDEKRYTVNALIYHLHL